MVMPLRNNDVWELDRINEVLTSDMVRVVELQRDIARTAARVRATSRLDLADAAVIATALHTQCDAIIGNDTRCARRVRDIPYYLLDDLAKEQSS